MAKRTTYKGIFYFRDYDDARAAAVEAGADRIIYYARGWAVRRRVSGPYLGACDSAMPPAGPAYAMFDDIA